jgi:hypothetical protein
MSSSLVKPYLDYTSNYEESDSSKNFLQTLDKYGVCVIPNVLDEKTCIEYRDNIWKDLKYLHQDRFDINDTSSWKNFYDMFPAHSFLIQHFGVAHLQSVWDIRQNKNIAKIFAQIHNVKVEDLRSSYDGISVGLPPEVTKRGWYKNSWLHCDQGKERRGRVCVQGQVNLYPVNEGDATLTVLEGSHLLHEEFFKDKENTSKTKDWYMLNEEDIEWYKTKGCKEVLIKAPIGSLILWDSRTIHSGHEVQKGRKKPNFRMVIYVCHLPKTFFDKRSIKRRQKALEERRVLNHWSAKMFPKDPRTYGAELKLFNKVKAPVLSELGKVLSL